MVTAPASSLEGFSLLADCAKEFQIVGAAIRRGLGLELLADGWHDRGVSISSSEWEKVTSLAIKQGIGPLVYTGLKRLDLELGSEAVSSLRATTIRAMMASRTALEKTLGRALTVLHDAGLRPIVLKGAFLAYSVYPEPLLRTLGDVDLLLPQPELHTASDALLAGGFTSVADYAATFPKVEHHLPPYFLPDSSITVELHHELLSPPHPFRIDVTAIRDRSVPRMLVGRETRVPAPVDALHHTCFHLAFAHRYEVVPLRGLVDILALSHAHATSLDWDCFLSAVRSSRTAGAVFWPLLMSTTWLGAEVPRQVLSALAPAPAYRRLLEPFADPGFLFGDRAAPGAQNSAMLGLLRDVSLRGGCPLWVQALTLWRSVFRSPDDVGHVSPAVKESRVRYAAYLLNPKRLVRGMAAAGRVVVAGATRGSAR